MNETTFVKLSVFAFGLVLVSFIVRGLSRLVVTPETASLLSAPTMLLGAGLIVLLTLRSVLAISGVRPLGR
jgi:hypothetical protein